MNSKKNKKKKIEKFQNIVLGKKGGELFLEKI